MSIAAVLAHEYYGHRTFRKEYLDDEIHGRNFHTTPIWQDECRASITAAKITPNLTDMERSHLVMDAIYRAQEFGQYIEMDDFMKEVLYGYSSNGEKNITHQINPNQITPIIFVSNAGYEGGMSDRACDSDMSEMPFDLEDFDDTER